MPRELCALPLMSRTEPRWVELAVRQLDEVLVDHAHCERKAATAALRLISGFSEHPRVVAACVKLAQEELRHFRQVHEILRRRRLVLTRDPGDLYAHALQQHVRAGNRRHRLTDQLLVNALIEARSCERLGLLGEALEDAKLAAFYRGLAAAEAGHHRVFVDLACGEEEAAIVQARLTELAAHEAEIVAQLPLVPRIH